MQLLSVKGIFRVLIGTIVLLTVISLVIEMINISISSIQLTQMAKISCRQAAVLLSQETYKERAGSGLPGLGSTAGSTFMDDVVTIDGAQYISGRFYDGADAESIYANMYKNSSEFKEWLKSSQIAGKWDSIELIALGLNGSNSIGDVANVSMPSDMSNQAALTRYSRWITAQAYSEVMMTPLNMGVPYLDKATLQRIFQWNLASIASDCNKDKIRLDESGRPCIYYNGFRIYADEATIENLDYKTYDATGAGYADFKYDTGIDANQLGFQSGVDLGSTVGTDERQSICVVGIEYKIEVAYEGITPIRKIFDFIWDNEVEGWEVQGTGQHGQVNRAPQQSWHDTRAELTSGGFGGTDLIDPSGNVVNPGFGVLPVPGRLMYYIVR